MIYEHNDTKNRYLVLDKNAEMKHPETREWIPAVSYIQTAPPKDNRIFTRTRESFEANFTPVS